MLLRLLAYYKERGALKTMKQELVWTWPNRTSNPQTESPYSLTHSPPNSLILRQAPWDRRGVFYGLAWDSYGVFIPLARGALLWGLTHDHPPPPWPGRLKPGARVNPSLSSGSQWLGRVTGSRPRVLPHLPPSPILTYDRGHLEALRASSGPEPRVFNHPQTKQKVDMSIRISLKQGPEAFTVADVVVVFGIIYSKQHPVFNLTYNSFEIQ